MMLFTSVGTLQDTRVTQVIADAVVLVVGTGRDYESEGYDRDSLTLPGQQPNYFQRNRDKWLLLNFVHGALILLLSATLRRMWDSHG